MEDFSKNSRKKNPKTRKKLNVSDNLFSPTLPSDVKKKPELKGKLASVAHEVHDFMVVPCWIGLLPES